MVGDIKRLSSSLLLSSLPLHPLYVVDIMIYPTASAQLSRFGINTNNSSNVALLIHTPEHYDRSGQHLVGLQAMRVRHLKMMGFQVMCVNLTKVNQLMFQPSQLELYLQNLYKQATTTQKKEN